MSADPIERRHVDTMNAVASVLAETFAGYGFALLVFEFGGTGRMNYISNAQRDDMLAALREFAAHLQQPVPPAAH